MKVAARRRTRRRSVASPEVGRPDDRAPLFGFLGDELAELDGRQDERRGPELGQARIDSGIRKARIDVLVQPVDDLNRRVPGHGKAVPGARLVTRQKLVDRRQVRSASEGTELVTASARNLPALM